MILSGIEIRKQIQDGHIRIDPLDESHINPVSVDLTLGDEVAVYDHLTTVVNEGRHDGEGLYLAPHSLIDTKEPVGVRSFRISDAGWILKRLCLRKFDFLLFLRADSDF